MKELSELTFEEYRKAKLSGKFWVHYPEATGNYEKDVLDRNNSDGVSLKDKTSKQKHQHYFKHWNGKIDPYRICDLFEVNDAAISHAVKKLLCTGNRGHKDFRKDIEDVIDTLERKLEMIDEDSSDK